MSDATVHPPLSRAQAVTMEIRSHLRRLGGDDNLASRVVPWADITGRPAIHLPALPLDVAERFLAALVRDEAAS